MKVGKFSGTIHARRRFRIWSESRQQYVTSESLSAIQLLDTIRKFYSRYFLSEQLGSLIDLAWTKGTTARHRAHGVNEAWRRSVAHSTAAPGGTPQDDLEIHGRWEYRYQKPNQVWSDEILTHDAMVILLQQKKIPKKTISDMLAEARRHAMKNIGSDNDDWLVAGDQTAVNVDLSPRRTWWQWLWGGWLFRHLKA